MEPWFWLAGFVPLVVVDLVLVRRWRERMRGRWSLGIAPGVLGLYGAGWVLDELGAGEAGTGAWLAMTAMAGVGVVPCAVAGCWNRRQVRAVAWLNALALGGLATRIVVFVRGIEWM